MSAAPAPPRRALPLPLRVALAPLTLLERARGRWRVVLVVAYLLGLAASAVLAWWATALLGLPDVGEAPPLVDPPVAVAEGRDAWPLYTRAVAMHVDRAISDGSPVMVARSEPRIRHWLEDNRAAMDLWRQGTERPEVGRPLRAAWVEGMVSHLFHPYGGLPWFGQMACIEGELRRDAGDMAGAWGWFRAVERCSRHVRRRGDPASIQVGAGLHARALNAARAWAERPDVDAALLRRALGEALADDAEPGPSDADLLRAEYRGHLPALERLIAEADRQEYRAEGNGAVRHLLIPGIGELGAVPQWARYRLGREAERSRRVFRLAFANWIAAAEAGRLGRPAIRSQVGPNSAVDFFEPGPDAPPAARALPPRALARWMESTEIARDLLAGAWPQFQSARRREHNARGELAETLATALYEREHNEPPPSREALVGPYLPRLTEPLPADPVAVPTTRDEAKAAGGLVPGRRP